MKVSKQDVGVDTLCPITRSASVVGDRWSMVIVRELMMGVGRFQDLLAQTGATPQLLAGRLKRLEAGGVIDRRVYSKKPLRHEYRLTPMGRELTPVILALRAWGEIWVKSRKEGVAVRMTHSSCGSEVPLDGVCPACRTMVAWRELRSEPTAAYRAERSARAARFA